MPYDNPEFIAEMTLDIDFQNKKKVSKEPYNTDDMVKEFLYAFPRFAGHFKTMKIFNLIFSFNQNFKNYFFITFMI